MEKKKEKQKRCHSEVTFTQWLRFGLLFVLIFYQIAF